ncbi:two-component sensor histidine kinase [Roseburia sp. BX1005]|uniref:histidine kinase n=1 Tax=Roseburia zhanii TaxID=2763064 RepID=A0A923LQE1_9FIRM|nr:ATP-binding protein [Roseburia zhanii]MBC5714552.1 two-component sensor histidine kinase [Roseburia zhanii]OLA81980.1 MAG: two-component sensor histidine kinase [Roseburia sp. 40_7]
MSNKKKCRGFFKSLRVRLFVLFLLIGILPSAVIRIGMLNSYEKKAVSNRSIDILSQAKILTNQIVFNDYLNDSSSEIINAQLEQLSNIYAGRIMVIDGNFRIIKDTYSLDTGKTIVSEEVMQSFRGEEISKYDSQNGYIEMTVPLTKPESKEILGVLLVSVSTDSIMLNKDYLESSAWIIEVFDAMIIILLSLFLSGLLVRPFGRMEKEIVEIQNGYKTELDVPSYLETQNISIRFNQLFGRMKIIDESREEFVSNVSHELKTPLTSMKVLADSLNGQEDVPVELYKEFMLDIGNEIDRETKIINDLLSLVKMDRSAGDMNITSVNINELLELILKRLRPIAEKQHIELVLESFRPVSAEVDEVKLTLAITNLIENGIKYNKPDGWVHVSLNADHQYFYVKVEDSGIGIPEDSLEHIYERFYRVDKSHSREIGGTGLGLAITRNAILMHRGAIKVFSTEGEGTIFNVRIPLNYIAS